MISDRVRAALSAADPAQFAALLHPDARWGDSCRSRSDVLAWYQGLLDQGIRFTVRSIQPDGDLLHVTLDVTGPAGAWTAHQAVRVRGDQVVEIQPED
jgi:hypothetical protein